MSQAMSFRTCARALPCCRLSDTSVMVRKAALQGAQLVLLGVTNQAAAQTHTHHRLTWHWPQLLQLAEALCGLLTVAPDSALASHDLQQVRLVAIFHADHVSCA